jgi:hypothetical protein
MSGATRLFPRNAASALVLVCLAALALVVHRLWGLRGSLGLIAFWAVAWLGFFVWRRRVQRQIRARFKSMTGRQRAEALFALNEEDRAEVLEAIDPGRGGAGRARESDQN